MGKFFSVFIASAISISLVACGGSDGGKRKKRGDGDGSKPNVEGQAAKKAEAKKRFGELAQYRSDNAKLMLGKADGTKIPMTVEIFSGDDLNVRLKGDGSKNTNNDNALDSAESDVTADVRHIDQEGRGYPSFVYVFVKYPSDREYGDLYVFAYTEDESPINVLGPVETSREVSVLAFQEELELYDKEVKNVNYFSFMKITLEYFQSNPGAGYSEYQVYMEERLETELDLADNDSKKDEDDKKSDQDFDIVTGSGGSQYAGDHNGSMYCDAECMAENGSVYDGREYEYRRTTLDQDGRVLIYSNSEAPAQYVGNPIQVIKLPCDTCSGRDSQPKASDEDWSNGIPRFATQKGHRWDQCLDDRVKSYMADSGEPLPVYHRGELDGYESPGLHGCTKEIRERTLENVKNGTHKAKDNDYLACIPAHLVKGGFKRCRIQRLKSGVVRSGSGSSRQSDTGSRYDDSQDSGSRHSSTGQQSSIDVRDYQRTETGGSSNSQGVRDWARNTFGGNRNANRVRSAELWCGQSYGSTLDVYGSGVRYVVPDRRACIKKNIWNIGTTVQSPWITLLETIPGADKTRVGVIVDFSKAKQGEVFIDDLPTEILKSNNQGTVKFNDAFDTFEMGNKTSFKILIESFDNQGDKSAEYIVGCQVEKLDYVCKDD